MATAHPQLDLYNPLVQVMRDDFEKLAFPGASYEDYEPEARRIFSKNAYTPHIRALIADVLSGRWGLGNTQAQVAEELAIERTALSDGLCKGTLSLHNYMMLRFHPWKPTGWDIRCIPFDLMNRNGFIAVCRQLTTRVPTRPGLDQRQFDEFHYELMCDLFLHAESWQCASTDGRIVLAGSLLQKLFSDPDRDILPFWKSPAEREQLDSFISNLLSDPKMAFDHVVEFQNRWQDIFVGACTLTEALLWSKS
ncbi:MAG TPA: hypothetical protein VHQ47_06095 [Phycisphaerae bacterium]|nr:hypothetical protein [Phycisphaerae bacterium]